MASDATGDDGNPFDLGKIKQLVRLMRDNDLAEIDLRWLQSRVRLRRGSALSETIVATTVPSQRAVVTERSEVPAAEKTAERVAAKANSVLITSPIVGTFYSAANPESDMFVKVGTRVGPDTTVCIIEAMKVFNEIPAGVTGTIAEILVENGSSVEFGQPMFRVET